MATWWNQLSALQQIFAVIALPATLILVLQTILLFIGMGGHGDMDAGGADSSGLDGGHFDMPSDGHADIPHDFHDGHSDVPDSGLALFTLRGIVSFFTIGGWLGFAMVDWGAGNVLTIIIAFAGGFAALVGTAYFFKAAMKLQSDGTVLIQNAIGLVGKVYITVPPDAQPGGKVNVTVQERFSEFSAITKGHETIKTGTPVNITGIIANDVLIVEPVAFQEQQHT